MNTSDLSASAPVRAVNRSSNFAPEPFSHLPELAAPCQVNDKEVAGSDGKQPVEVLAYALPQTPRADAPELQYSAPVNTAGARHKSRRWTIWICVVIGLLLLGIGLGCGLAFGLKSSK